MGQSSGSDGCYAAVGSIDHSIQLWNLEEADPLEPAQVLGCLAELMVDQHDAFDTKQMSITNGKRRKEQELVVFRLIWDLVGFGRLISIINQQPSTFPQQPLDL